ncbi:MAG: hypothetical protein AAB466_02200 [Verrucomicrobiota bacterium]
MVAHAELERLESRKRELVLQSDACRRRLEAECRNLQLAAAWVDRGYAFWQRARPVLVWVAPVLGYWAARKWWRLAKISAAAAAVFRIYRKWSEICGPPRP